MNFRFEIPIKTLFALTTSFLIVLITWASPAAQQRIEIPSSFNPVGSGARALGMGGAFIAVADDATAASWNPAGLVQLERPEFSLVLSALSRTEDNTFGTEPEASGRQSIAVGEINYLSFAKPFKLDGFRSAAFSISYQRLYDMHRHWKFDLATEEPGYSLNQQVDYSQKGTLSAMGIAYSTEINREISAGLTLNIWDSGLNPNQWEQETIQTGDGFLGATHFIYRSRSFNRYDFSGYNFNLGLRWQIINTPNHGITIGAVFKSSFEADVTRKNRYETLVQYPTDPTGDQINSGSSTSDLTLEMPASYGIGLVWRKGNRFMWALDLYRTEWGNFILTNEQGEHSSPITGMPEGQSDIAATLQVRTGIQYILNDLRLRYHEAIIPVRFGLFYDPAPAENDPDDFYGFSMGTAVSLKKASRTRFSIDIAYQYRTGRDVGRSILQHLDFSQDIDEHSIYLSLIYYL